MAIGWGPNTGGGAVSSVFTRTGAVVATAGDYSSLLVSDASTAGGPTAKASFDSLVLSLASKAALASPTFTGDPQAPTASPGDNDTSIATTAFVTSAVATGGWQSISGQWTWTATPQTVLTLAVAEGEAKSLLIYVNVLYYRTATTTFSSSGARIAVGSYRRAIGGSAVVNTAATLNAGTVPTVSIAMLASGNNVLVNFGAGIATNEAQVVYYDAVYKTVGRTITY